MDIHWQATFFYINDDESSTTTSNYASRVKSNRVKHMLEELPTIEHLIHKRPDLYNGWNCPMCKDEKETFAHIWICKNQRHLMNQIIFNNKHFLVSLMNKYIPDINVSIRNLAHDHLWSCDSNSSCFNFFDLIKGFVPLFLFDLIDNYSHNSNLTLQIISNFINNVFLDSRKFIWLLRCEQMLLNKFHARITVCPWYSEPLI
jgi:hypothetical protein